MYIMQDITTVSNRLDRNFDLFKMNSKLRRNVKQTMNVRQKTLITAKTGIVFVEIILVDAQKQPILAIKYPMTNMKQSVAVARRKLPAKNMNFANKGNVYQLLLIHQQLQFSQKSPQKVNFLIHSYDISTNLIINDILVFS